MTVPPNRGKLAEKLLDVTAEVFAEKGFHAASMRDIARRLGCTPAALYYHAESKEELLFKIAHEAFRRVLEPLETPTFQALTPPDQLRFIIHNHLFHFTRNLNLMKVLAHDAHHLNGQHYEIIQNMKRNYVNLVIRVLTELHPEARQLSPATLRWSALALFGMLNWIYTWFRQDDLEHIDQYAEHLYFIFLDGFYRIQDNQSMFQPFFESFKHLSSPSSQRGGLHESHPD